MTHGSLNDSTALFIMIIVLFYLIHAFRIAKFSGRKLITTPAGRANLAQSTVFILCASTGYAAYLLGLSDLWHTILHGLLAVAAIWLVASGAARIIGKSISEN